MEKVIFRFVFRLPAFSMEARAVGCGGVPQCCALEQFIAFIAQREAEEVGEQFYSPFDFLRLTDFSLEYYILFRLFLVFSFSGLRQFLSS